MARDSSACMAPITGESEAGIGVGAGAAAAAAAEKHEIITRVGISVFISLLVEEGDEALARLGELGPLVAALAQEGVDGADAGEGVVGGGIGALAIGAEEHQVALALVDG